MPNPLWDLTILYDRDREKVKLPINKLQEIAISIVAPRLKINLSEMCQLIVRKTQMAISKSTWHNQFNTE